MTNMQVQELCALAKSEANNFSAATCEQKNAVLESVKKGLFDAAEEILAANKVDLLVAETNGRNATFIERLTLNPARIKLMADGLSDIIALPDPVGEVVEDYTRPSGIHIKKVRAPLGVIGIIFEARPNVAIDAAALCIKSGNGVVLRASRESVNSVKALVAVIKKALVDNGFGEGLVANIVSEDRNATIEMLKQDRYIDVVIPRGGEGLKRVVLDNAEMPVIASAGGNCHMYLSESSTLDMTIPLVINAKTQRPSVCNALETLLISRKKNKEFVTEVLKALEEKGVEVRGTKEVNGIYPVKVIENEEFYHEYEELIIKVKMVDDVEEAIAHINEYGTHHSDAIVTSDDAEVSVFTKKVDSAAVYVNTSTRFTDGFEFGLGAEMGISTQRLHVRGPIGLRELTSVKYVVDSNGQVRK